MVTMPLFRYVTPRLKKKNRLINGLIKSSLFLLLYLASTFIVVPIIAKPLGRIPLPIFSNNSVKPLNIMTCILNRHYVTPDLYRSLEQISIGFNSKYSESTIAYLDANFPFINNYPLLPHLSHNDGKKLDIALFYYEKETKIALNKAAPSPIGYGVYEMPKMGEINQPFECEKQGYWQYSILQNFVPQNNNENFVFDKERTAYLMSLIIKEANIQKIFIEPHLKQRMNIDNDKVRFHGCQAVRHDDHIHIQLN